MKPLEPNTRTRLSVAELSAVPVSGAAAGVRVLDGASGATSDVPGGPSFALMTSASPNLLVLSWDMDGVEVSCEVEVVSSRYCSLDDVRSYRADEYQNGAATDDDVFAARERAESTIEAAANRMFQPVARRAFVDRPGCTTRTQAMSDNGTFLHDILDVLRATYPDGTDAPVRPVRRGSQFLDVAAMPRGTAAECLMAVGMSPTPPEARDAVRELAAWFLASRQTPDNALSVSNEAGVVSFVVSGVNGETPLPEVNALIGRYERRDVVIG